MKKTLAILLTLCMIANLFVLGIISTSAAETLPANTVIVKLDADENTTSVEWQGKTYSVKFGETVFATLQTAGAKIEEGGTLMLCPGSYPAFAPGKSITILGPQAGVDPNVRGANKTDDWTMNPARSATDATKEAIFTGAIFTTSGDENTVFENFTLNIDGVVFAAGYIRSLNFSEGVQNINVKNIISTNRGVPLIWSVAGASKNVAENTCKRYITVENARAVGMTSVGLFGNLAAEKFTASGIYVDKDCGPDTILSLFVTSENAGTDAVEFKITDSMFHSDANRVLNLNLRKGNYSTFNDTMDKKASVSAIVDGCVFLDCAVGDGKAIQTQFNTPNVKMIITNNIFKQTNGTVTGYRAIEDYSTVSDQDFSANYTIDNNTFDNVYWVAKIKYTTENVKITKSLSLDENGQPIVPVVWQEAKAEIVNYYTDVNKTNLKTVGEEDTPVIDPDELNQTIAAIPEGLFTAPEAGQTLVRNLEHESNQFTASTAKWYNEDDQQVYTAEAGCTYTATVTLTVISSMLKFDPATTTVPASYTATFSEDGKSVELKQTFTVAGEKATEPVETEEVTTPEEDETNVPETNEQTDTTTNTPDQTDGEGGCASGITGTAVIGMIAMISLAGVSVCKKK